MLGAALHNIDARGLYAGVAQQVGQLRQVLVQGVKGPGVPGRVFGAAEPPVACPYSAPAPGRQPEPPP